MRWRTSEWTAEYSATRHQLSPKTVRWWASQLAAEIDVEPTTTLVPVAFTGVSTVAAPVIELDFGAQFEALVGDLFAALK